jgi:hypothetical protein
MKTLLAAMCVLTLLAIGSLSLSLFILRPPRANYSTWFTLATIVAVQSVGTFIAMANPRTWLRTVVAGGGAALAAVGVWMVRDTLTSPHFEGYALVLGAMLVMQGILTLAAFARASLTRGLTG